MSDNGALYATTLCAAVFLAFHLEWTTQWNEITASSRAKGAAFVGKCSRCPQGRSNMENIHNDGKEVQYASILPSLFPTSHSSNLFEDSDVVHLRLLTTDFIVLNSPEAISDLTEKRSDIYSDRVSPRENLAQWC
jgi:hypothetical protein